jgi:DNA-binding XRE family transcriptional regulator
MDNNINRVIQQKKITQATLANMVGVKREYINRIINKKITPTVPLAMRIAKALKVPTEELFVI